MRTAQAPKERFPKKKKKNLKKKSVKELTKRQINPIHAPQPTNPPLRVTQLAPAPHLGKAHERRHARFQAEDEQREGHARVVAEQGGERPEGEWDVVDELEELERGEPRRCRGREEAVAVGREVPGVQGAHPGEG